MRTLLIAGAIILIGLAVYFVVISTDAEPVVAEPATFEECAALYPVMESFPRRCVTPSGVEFVEDVQPAPEPGEEEPGVTGIPNLILVSSPTNGDEINSPLTITGSARGTWYFEASFPVEIRNAAGEIIAQGPAQAQGEWMTEDFVPFETTLSFPAQPAGSQGTVILRKDNPSGLPENDQDVTIPVVF